MKSIATQYKPTLLVSSIGDFRHYKSLRAGQWVQLETGARGQYMGITDSGCVCIRWQSSGVFSKRDAINNRNLRRFAVTYGAK